MTNPTASPTPDTAPPKQEDIKDYTPPEIDFGFINGDDSQPQESPRPAHQQNPPRTTGSGEGDSGVAASDDYEVPSEFRSEESQSKSENSDDEGNGDESDEQRAARKERNDSLRRNLEEANKAKKLAEARWQESQREAREAKERAETLERQLTEARQQAEMQVPADQHPDVAGIYSQFESEVAEAAEAMDLIGDGDGVVLAREIGTLINAYSRIGQRGDPNHEENATKFRNRMRSLFGNNIERAFAIVRRGAEAHFRAQAKKAEIENNRGEYALRSERQRYEELSRQAREIHNSWFDADSDFRMQNPDHPKTILAEEMEKRQELHDKSKRVTDFLRYATLPLPPARKEDLEGKTEKEVKEYLEGRKAAHFKAVQSFGSRMGQAFLALEFLPTLYRELNELRERVGASNPSRGASRDEAPRGNHSGPATAEDFRNFQPEPFDARSIMQD